MSTLKSPTAHADEAQAALRALAHATQQIDDPSEIYAVLGALSQAAASLSQSLHQIGSFHDRRIRAATGTLGAPVQAGMTYRGVLEPAQGRRDDDGSSEGNRQRPRGRGHHGLPAARSRLPPVSTHARH